MSADEFLNARGAPRGSRQISEEEAQSATGRLPVELIDFWRRNGIGYYANRNYWLCTPAMFDSLLQGLLADVPELRPEDLAAFGYSSFGAIDLWHSQGRHFTFSLDAALLMDLTSRTRTEPPPHDLDELYISAGMEMPENAVELFLEARSRPEDIWMILLNATSDDTFKMVFDDKGKALIPQLRRSLGELAAGELYCRDKGAVANTADQYSKQTIAEVVARLPRSVRYSFAVEVGGAQQIIERTIGAGLE